MGISGCPPIVGGATGGFCGCVFAAGEPPSQSPPATGGEAGRGLRPRWGAISERSPLRGDFWLPPHCGGATGGFCGCVFAAGEPPSQSPPAVEGEAGRGLRPRWGAISERSPLRGDFWLPPHCGGATGGFCGCVFAAGEPPSQSPPATGGEAGRGLPAVGGEAGRGLCPRWGAISERSSMCGDFWLPPHCGGATGGFCGCVFAAGEPPSQSPPATGGEAGRGLPAVGGEAGRGLCPRWGAISERSSMCGDFWLPPHCGGATGGSAGACSRRGSPPLNLPPRRGERPEGACPRWGERPEGGFARDGGRFRSGVPCVGISGCPPIVGGLRGVLRVRVRGGGAPLSISPRDGGRGRKGTSPAVGGEAGRGLCPRWGAISERSSMCGGFWLPPHCGGATGGFCGCVFAAGEPPSQSPPATGGEAGRGLRPRWGERPEGGFARDGGRFRSGVPCVGISGCPPIVGGLRGGSAGVCSRRGSPPLNLPPRRGERPEGACPRWGERPEGDLPAVGERSEGDRPATGGEVGAAPYCCGGGCPQGAQRLACG